MGLTTLGLLTGSLSANAATWNFSYTNSSTINASGQLTTDTAGTLITGITGTRNGVNITSLLAPNSLGSNDNVFIPSGSPAFLTGSGLSYQTSDSIKYNLYYSLAST